MAIASGLQAFEPPRFKVDAKRLKTAKKVLRDAAIGVLVAAIVWFGGKTIRAIYDALKPSPEVAAAPRSGDTNTDPTTPTCAAPPKVKLYQIYRTRDSNVELRLDPRLDSQLAPYSPLEARKNVVIESEVRQDLETCVNFVRVRSRTSNAVGWIQYDYIEPISGLRDGNPVYCTPSGLSYECPAGY